MVPELGGEDDGLDVARILEALQTITVAADSVTA